MEEELPKGYYRVEKILDHKFDQGWKFLTQWEGYPVSSSTWEPPKNFKLPNQKWNEVFVEYCESHNVPWRKKNTALPLQQNLHIRHRPEPPLSTRVLEHEHNTHEVAPLSTCVHNCPESFENENGAVGPPAYGNSLFVQGVASQSQASKRESLAHLHSDRATLGKEVTTTHHQTFSLFSSSTIFR